MHNGVYQYDELKIASAHMWCQQLFLENLKEGTDTVIVANTNTRESYVNLYRKLAIEHGYMVFVLTVENWHDGQDVHNVPEDVKTKMRESLIKSIKL
jgi:hypothetical protein